MTKEEFKKKLDSEHSKFIKIRHRSKDNLLEWFNYLNLAHDVAEASIYFNFSDELHSGMYKLTYFPNEDTISFAKNKSLVVSIDSSGKILTECDAFAYFKVPHPSDVSINNVNIVLK